MNICLIPARGGSKRIPKKNIVDFFGKPLAAYTIEAAQKSGLFGEQIYLSSDSEEILALADAYKGVQKLRRPAEISGDNASLEDASLHLLGSLPDQSFDYLCMLMPNCPLRIAEDIRKSFELILNEQATCLMSVAEYRWLYPFWALQEQEVGLKPFFGEKYFVDSKLLPKEIYCPCGAIRWVSVKNFVKEKKYYGRNLKKYVIPFERAADIDTLDDLELAKKLYPITYGHE